jgi:hypothetical protein
MTLIKPFLAGAFLGSGAIGALANSVLPSAWHNIVVASVFTLADVADFSAAIFCGIIAVSFVNNTHKKTAA